MKGVYMETEEIRRKALEEIKTAKTVDDLNRLRVCYLGKKGLIQGLMAEMRNLSAEEKPVFGQAVNACKHEVEQAFEARRITLQAAALERRLENEKIDVTLDEAGIYQTRMTMGGGTYWAMR